MADFCKQCSEYHFGEDFHDLAKITTEEVWKTGRANAVLCEGCGLIQVAPDGRCVSSDCLLKHGTKEDWKHV